MKTEVKKEVKAEKIEVDEQKGKGRQKVEKSVGATAVTEAPPSEKKNRIKEKSPDGVDQSDEQGNGKSKQMKMMQPKATSKPAPRAPGKADPEQESEASTGRAAASRSRSSGQPKQQLGSLGTIGESLGANACDALALLATMPEEPPSE